MGSRSVFASVLLKIIHGAKRGESFAVVLLGFCVRKRLLIIFSINNFGSSSPLKKKAMSGAVVFTSDCKSDLAGQYDRILFRRTCHVQTASLVIFGVLSYHY